MELSNEIGIYVHWPFCIKKCYYCDLNSHVREGIAYEKYVDKLCQELEVWHTKFPEATVSTVFFGGGTPSLMKPAWIARILQLIKSKWKSSPSEITIEANPTTTECSDLDGFLLAGINRLSFGVQTFNDIQLQTLGRTHTGNQALLIIKHAMQLFNRVSVDLMYNLPDQSLDQIKDDLSIIMNLNIQHLSYYALTIQDNTAFGELYRTNKLNLPNEEEFCNAYELITSTLKLYGMHHYEISNFSFPDHESQHNLIYWRYLPFIGVGPGAHSRITLHEKLYAVANHKVPEKWLYSSFNDKASFEEIDRIDVIKEKLLMNLRIIEGISMQDIDRLLPESALKKLHTLVEIGAGQIVNEVFSLNTNGFLKYNAILKYMLADL